MPESSNVEQIRAWFRTCPAILDSNRFRVDYLAENPTEYAIYAVPTTINYHENVLGEYVPNDTQTLNFIFASKESFGADVQQNLANMGFYDTVTAWVIQQNSLRNFPQLINGRVTAIVPTLTAYPAEVGSSSAKYQIQLKLTYKRQ